MEGYKYLEKIRNYCDYLEDHLNNVWWAWGVLQKKCADMSFVYDDFVFESINSEIINHDVSKFHHLEFIPYRMKFFPVYKNELSEDSDVFDTAWEHHKIYNPHHPRAESHGYVLEHILVWEEAHGKPLPKGWVIHHLNGIPNDNRPQNLLAMPDRKHRRILAAKAKRIQELESLLNNQHQLLYQ